MSFSILVKNSPNTHKTGDVISVNDENHSYGTLESKTAFIAAGNPQFSWARPFVIVNVIGGSYLDYRYLTEMHYEYNDIESPEMVTASYKKYYIKTPPEESELFSELLDKAEITITLDALDYNIVSRI